MKFLMSLLVLTSSYAMAENFTGEEIPLNCLKKAESRMSKYKDLSLVSVCRDRKTPTKEHYTFCDGSGCTGFLADSSNNCKFTNWWDGQDDQDQIDETEWKESCLVAEDFKKPTASTELKSKKLSSEVKGISNASTYEFVGNTKGKSATELAEAIGKQIRREYYQRNYTVESHNYTKVTYAQAIKALKTSEGEFTALKASEISKIDRWFEDHSVAAVVQMNLETNYMSGTGLEQNFIFIPTEKYEPVLVVNRFYYAE